MFLVDECHEMLVSIAHGIRGEVQFGRVGKIDPFRSAMAPGDQRSQPVALWINSQMPILFARNDLVDYPLSVVKIDPQNCMLRPPMQEVQRPPRPRKSITRIGNSTAVMIVCFCESKRKTVCKN